MWTSDKYLIIRDLQAIESCLGLGVRRNAAASELYDNARVTGDRALFGLTGVRPNAAASQVFDNARLARIRALYGTFWGAAA